MGGGPTRPKWVRGGGAYQAEVCQGQTAQAADPGDVVVLQVEDGEAAAFLQACDLTETVDWQPSGGGGGSRA